MFLRHIRNFISFIAPPLGAIAGFIGAAYTKWTTGFYAHARLEVNNPENRGVTKATLAADTLGTSYTYGITLSRIATIAIATLCILAFIGALAFPLPGVAPLTAIALTPILQAIGITFGWTILARGVGMLIGGIGDYFKIRSTLNEASSSSSEQLHNEATKNNSTVLSHAALGIVKQAAYSTICGEADVAKNITDAGQNVARFFQAAPPMSQGSSWSPSKSNKSSTVLTTQTDSGR